MSKKNNDVWFYRCGRCDRVYPFFKEVKNEICYGCEGKVEKRIIIAEEYVQAKEKQPKQDEVKTEVTEERTANPEQSRIDLTDLTNEYEKKIKKAVDFGLIDMKVQPFNEVCIEFLEMIKDGFEPYGAPRYYSRTKNRKKIEHISQMFIKYEYANCGGLHIFEPIPDANDQMFLESGDGKTGFFFYACSGCGQIKVERVVRKEEKEINLNSEVKPEPGELEEAETEDGEDFDGGGFEGKGE